MDLRDLRRANIQRDIEWDPRSKITLLYRANELAGEVGETCNVVKKLVREEMGIKGSRDTIEHLADEIADALICLDLLAMTAHINLEEALIRKFNAVSKVHGLNTYLEPK